jgi:hypothetical protein
MISLADQLKALARPTEKILNGRPYARKDDLVQMKINPERPTEFQIQDCGEAEVMNRSLQRSF